MSTRKKYIALIVSFFVLVGMIGIRCMADSYSNLAEQDISTYSAKVIKVERNSEGTRSTNIYVEEYDKYLLVYPEIETAYDVDKVQEGDDIVFGIEKRYDDFLVSDTQSDADFFVTIVSLEREGQMIFTTADYNQTYQSSSIETTVGNYLLIVAAFVVFVISLVSIIKDKKKHSAENAL